MKIHIRAEKEIEDNFEYNLDITNNKKWDLGYEYKYNNYFEIGDVVYIGERECGLNFGYIINIEAEQCSVALFSEGIKTINKIDLIRIPLIYGLDIFESIMIKEEWINKKIYMDGWLELVNTAQNKYSEYLTKKEINGFKLKEVNILEKKEEWGYTKLYDKKIDRIVYLYMDCERFKIYKASLWSGEALDSYRKVFFILDSENDKIYTIGIDQEINPFLVSIYKQMPVGSIIKKYIWKNKLILVQTMEF